MKASTIAIVVTALATTACSAGPQASGSFESRASYDRLFTAAEAAAPSVGYHMVSADRANGLITAEQGVMMGHGSAVGMTVSVAHEGGYSTLHVAFVAPPGTFAVGGDFGQNVSQYASAVRATVPDLHASEVQWSR